MKVGGLGLQFGGTTPNATKISATSVSTSQPVRFGGFGVRRASDLALPAFLAYLHGSSDLVSKILSRCQEQHGNHNNAEGRSSNPDPGADRPGAVQERAERSWLSKSGLPLPVNRAQQQSWDRPLCEKKAADVRASFTDPQDLARHLAVTSPLAGAWLEAIPIPSLGLKLDDHQLRIACGLRLGANLCLPHRCDACGEDVDGRGTHGLSCKKSAGRHSRHGQVNDLLRRACASAGVPAILEPLGLPQSGMRPDGLTLIPWKQGRSLCWDFTCWDTVAQSHLALATAGGGKVAEEGERSKTRKYQGLPHTHMFAPFCIETFGAWGPSAKRLTKELGQRIQAATGEPRSTSFLTQAISVAVQRGNAASVLGTLPVNEALDAVFDFFP